MARTQNNQRRNKPWSTFPKLHDGVQKLLDEDNLAWTFRNHDDEKSCIDSYSTHIMGSFICYRKECPNRGWGSRKVAIRIRKYNGNQYNAVVYHQRCAKCDFLSVPKLNDSYAERVAYRIKRWSGIEMETPPFSEKSGPPHMSHLCEGCKAGHCTELLSLGIGSLEL